MQRAISRRGFVGSGLAGAALWATGARAAWGGSAEEVAELLEQNVLAAGVPGEQVRAFAKRRVPAMPQVDTVQQWEQHVERIRQQLFDHVIFVGEARRWRQSERRVVWSDTIEEPGYQIRKVRYEVLPGYWMPALLYEPETLEGRVPVVFCLHGHVGPGGGKARPVVQRRCINFVRRGMIAFTADWPDIGQLQVPGRHYRMHQLELCGTSGLAPFYLTLERGLDLLSEHPHADPERVCVCGQSGGGWQTIFIAALDQRVTLANPVAGHSSFRTRARHDSDLGDGEQQPNDMATIADYTHLTAMVAPRPQLLTFNANDDCCFATSHALPPLMEAAEPLYELYGAAGRLRAHNNMVVDPEPRGHNFGRENREVLYRMIADFWYADDPHFSRQDLDVEAELKSYEELYVDLPQNNHTFNSMARQLMEDLPRDPDIPQDEPQRKAWQQQMRPLLRQIVRFHDYDVLPEKVDERASEKLHGISWRLKMQEWNVPAVELVPAGAEATAVLLADAGRAAAAEQVGRLLAKQLRVVAIDPFYFGESALGRRDFLLALLVACVGQRPLGIQASQLAGVCRWRHDRDGQPPQVVAVGERTSTVALVAAALETQAIAGLQLHGPLNSLKQIIERDMLIGAAPELFCFGLLERFDIPQLQGLVDPRPVARHG